VQHPFRIISWLALSLSLAAACSRAEPTSSDGEPASVTARGDDTAIPKIRAAARALAQPDASVDYVAAELEGVVKARTTSQALIHYDGYRAIMTTPGERVTRVTFDLVERKPTLAQLTAVFGEPEEIGRGVIYEYSTETTSARIHILAETSEKPPSETALVRKVIVEGAKRR
jgi:hypothetical protein